MIEEILALPIEKKIGQLFFIGIGGENFDRTTAQLFAEIAPGGVCLFARNIKTAEQTRRLLDEIRKNSNVEPLLSVDQEGGRVDRLRRIIAPMPAPANLKSPESIKRLAQITAEVLRILGFNMNFAPVVDVIDEHRKHLANGLYSRMFGDDKETITRNAGIYLENLQNGGVLGCLKHFPGLGASNVDSHDALPLVEIDEAEFFAEDLYPYAELFRTKQVSAVMTAHAAYPFYVRQEKDAAGNYLPASLSPNFILDLLGGRLQFDGAVLTDDLEMGAIVKNYGIGQACLSAFAAGVDMLTICAGEAAIREGFEAISKAFAAGSITEYQINHKLKRIAALKMKIQPPLKFDADRLQELSQNITEII